MFLYIAVSDETLGWERPAAQKRLEGALDYLGAVPYRPQAGVGDDHPNTLAI